MTERALDAQSASSDARRSRREPRVLAILGDSNSLSNGTSPCWVDRVREAVSADEWMILNYAQAWAGSFQVAGQPNGWDQFERAMAGPTPTLVVIAFGTNDISWSMGLKLRPPRWHFPVLIRDLQRLFWLVRRSGAGAVVALAPLPGPGSIHPDRDGLTRLFNAEILSAFPKEVVLDFETISSSPGDLRDELHLSEQGHVKRARLVSSWLQTLPPEVPAARGGPTRISRFRGSAFQYVVRIRLGWSNWRWTRRLERQADRTRLRAV